MTREEFEKFKENHVFYIYDIDLDKLLKDAETQSIRENFNEQLKKAEMNNIIDFVKDYGSFSFRRTEKKSGDVIEFDITPLSWCHYWKDFKQIAFYIGYVKNSSGDIERFYMLEDGSFYNYNRKKIADNTADFLDYITTVEYDYHAPISENTYKQLKKAGWYEGRKIDISGLVEECEKDGVFLTEPQKRFIEEFGGLESPRQNADSNWIYISDNRRIQSHNTEFSYFINIFIDEDLELESEEINPVVKNYGENTVRIGEYGYYAQSILLAENGLMLLADDSGSFNLLCRTAMEGFNKMLR